MRNYGIASFLMFSLAAGCASSSAEKKAGPAPGIAHDETTLGRELAPLAMRPVSDASFTGQVESAATPELSNSGGLSQVLIPLGTEQPVRCFIYPKAINLAQTLRLFINSVVEHVNKHQVDRIDAGQINGSPYLAVGTSYMLERDGQKGTGQVKYLAARGDSTTTLCMHDEPGYAKTFERIATGFIASLKFPDNVSDPSRKLLVWRSLAVQRNEQASVGIIESRLYEGEAGYAFASSRSILSPAEDGSVRASDEAENQFSNLQGDIMEAKYIKIIDDTVAYNLGLNFEAANGYRVKGVFQGAPFATQIKTVAALPDFATQTAQMRKLFANKRNTEALHWLTYSPADPSHVSDVGFEKKADVNGTHQGILSSGGAKSQVEIDDMGTQKRQVSDHVTVERVWQAQGNHG